MSATGLYAREHALGMHQVYAPPGCPECPVTVTVTATASVAPAPVPAPAPVSDSGFVSLGNVIERLVVQRRGRLFGDGQPPEPEAPKAPDGNPWCEQCRGVRWVALRGEDVPTRYVPCPDCQTAAWAIDRRRQRLGMTIPARFANCRLDTFPTAQPEQARLVATLRAWLADLDKPSWLYLWGPTGRGKTGLATALLYELCERHSTAFQITTDLLSTIKATFGSADGESESSILDFLYSVDVFCLDDLGSEHHRGPEDWTSEKIFQLIGGRHAALKRTILTSNSSLDELQDKLGHPRTVRRIVEATTPRWIVDVRGLPSLT